MQTYAWETFTNVIQQLFISCRWERISIKGLLMEEPETNKPKKLPVNQKWQSFWPQQQANRRWGSRPHRLQRIHHPVPRQSRLPSRAEHSPNVKKLHLNSTFFSKGATPLPQIPERLWRIFQKPVLSSRRAIDTSHTSTRIGLELVMTLRLFQRKPRVFRCEAAPGRMVGADGGCLLSFCLQRLPATFLGRWIKIQVFLFIRIQDQMLKSFAPADFADSVPARLVLPPLGAGERAGEPGKEAESTLLKKKK